MTLPNNSDGPQAGIPQDVRNIANSIAWDLPARVARVNREFASNVIARAILAERERCAKVADGYFSNESDDYSNGQDDTAERIAAAIRKGGEA